MHSKPSLLASPVKEPSGALSKPHLKTLRYCAAWITRGCSNVHGNNATWWTPSGWSAPTKFLKQREGRVMDSAVAASRGARYGRRTEPYLEGARIRAIETERGARFAPEFEPCERPAKIDIFCGGSRVGCSRILF